MTKYASPLHRSMGVSMSESKPQTTSDAAQAIEQLAKQETGKLRSRLSQLLRLPLAQLEPLSTEIDDVRQCIKLLNEGSRMIAAALFDIDSP